MRKVEKCYLIHLILCFFPNCSIGIFYYSEKIRYVWLLVVSYYFYMCWNVEYALLIGISTIITYLSGLLLGKFQKIWLRKLVVALSFISNLGILIFYKYFDFILENVNLVLQKMELVTDEEGGLYDVEFNMEPTGITYKGMNIVVYDDVMQKIIDKRGYY